MDYPREFVRKALAALGDTPELRADIAAGLPLDPHFKAVVYTSPLHQETVQEAWGHYARLGSSFASD